jgi:hypothetical protein
MFFVGATGQLLTLILTVCLPFVFLVSSQPKTELLQETLNFENQIIQPEVSFTEINNFKFDVTCTDKLQNINVEVKIKEIFIRKIPPVEFLVKWKSFYSESSGNKAPPSFHSFSC